MKKTLSVILQVMVAYVMGVVYGYYNFPEPDNKYSWLITAVMLIIFIIVCLIVKLVEKVVKKRRKK